MHQLDDSFFAVSTHLDRLSVEQVEREVALLTAAGVKAVRYGMLWSQTEPEPGRYDWVKHDFLVDYLTGHGIQILPVLAQVPKWCSPAGESREFRFHPPSDPAMFAEFVGRSVGRYRNMIHHWEIWNEPNSNNFWYPKADAVAYARLLELSYRAAKEAEPSCAIMNGGIACCREGRINFAFLREFFCAGGGRWLDIVNIHPYAGPNPPELVWKETLASLRELQRQTDTVRPVWITEIGTPLQERFACSPAEQAAHVVRNYLAAAACPEVERVFWYDFRDDGIDPGQFEHHFGLVDHDYSPKAAYHAYRVMTSQLTGTAFYCQESRHAVGMSMFRGRDEAIAVLWAPEMTSLNLPDIDFALTAIAFDGSALPLFRQGNALNLTLRPQPCYCRMALPQSEVFRHAFLNAAPLICI